ncbi:MAG TPA: hypothetical protein VKF83_08375 [Stellaceae bacterium]|nr:hypothetical protein [Stellaceae bacterium]
MRALPTVQPGKLWLVEFPSTEPELSPLEYRALTTANVVIYDRILAPTVARLLPFGGYAEPAASRDKMGDAAWERALRFARDGWSVAKLLDTEAPSRREKIREIRRLTDRLLPFGLPVHLPVSVFYNLGGQVYEKTETELGELGAILAVRAAEQSPSFTIIFDVADGGSAPRFSVASANGLAG